MMSARWIHSEDVDLKPPQLTVKSHALASSPALLAQLAVANCAGLPVFALYLSFSQACKSLISFFSLLTFVASGVATCKLT